MKIYLLLFAGFTLLSCADKNVPVKAQDEQEAKEAEIAGLVYSYEKDSLSRIVMLLNELGDESSIDDQIKFLYNLEFTARTPNILGTDSSRVIYENTKSLVHDIIVSRQPLYYGTGGGNQNSYQLLLEKDHTFRVYWRTGFGVTYFNGTWNKNEKSIDLLTDDKNAENVNFKYCSIIGDSLKECSSNRFRIMKKESL